MLRCLSAFRSSYGSWQPGDVIDNPALEPGLMASSADSFEVVIADKPGDVEVDKMIRRGRPRNEVK